MKDNLAFGTAAIGLVAFVALIILFLGRVNATELAWTRSMYLLNGVEAIAFAAAGWLFGKEVHRKQAETAEEQATEAKREAKEQTEAARLEVTQVRAELQSEKETTHTYQTRAEVAETKGSDLAKAILATAVRRSTSDEGHTVRTDHADNTVRTEAVDALADLASIAKALYPEAKVT